MTNYNLKYIKTFCCFIFMGIQWAIAQDGNVITPPAYTTSLVNFVRTWDAKAPTTDPNVLVGKPVKEVLQTYSSTGTYAAGTLYKTAAARCAKEIKLKMG